MTDFVTLTDLKAALDVTDSTRDAVLTAANSAATAMIIDFCNRDPRAADFVERADGRGSATILVNQYPINSVASVTIDGTAVPSDQIDYDENLIWLKCRIPRGRRNVTVSYNAGLNPLPAAFTQAALYTARAILTARKIDLNASGESWADVTSQSWATAPGTVPVSAQVLLAPYVRRFAV